MPVTIKTANMKYKNSNGEYVGINAIAETKIEEQIAAIQSAGEQALNDINTRKTQIDNILPSDYTELNNKIDNIIDDTAGDGDTDYVWSAGKTWSEIHNQIDEICNLEIITTEWEQGTLNSETGSTKNSPSRVRTPEYIYFEDNVNYLSIIPKTGFYFNVYRYDLSNTLLDTIRWTSTPTHLKIDPVANKFKIILRLDSGDDFTPSDLPEDVLIVTAFHTTDKTFTMVGKAADADEVGKTIQALNAENLIWNTLDINLKSISTRPSVNGLARIRSNGGTLSAGEHGLKVTATEENANLYFILGSITKISSSSNNMYGLEPGETYTLSFDFKCKRNVICNFNMYLYEKTEEANTWDIKSGTFAQRLAAITETDVESVTHVEFTYTFNQNTAGWSWYMHFGSSGQSNAAIGDYIEIDNIILQKALKGSGWKPAIHDYKIDNAPNIIKFNDPTLMIEKLQQLNKKMKIDTHTSGTKILSLLWFSDIHGDGVALDNIITFRNAYNDYIDDIICTGDIVKNQFSDGMDFWNGVEGAEKILTCIGNHETRDTSLGTGWDGWNAYNMVECYEAYIKPYYVNWGDAVTIEDKTYYYKDYSTENVRLIVLDIMHQTEDQLTWFQDLLDSAKINDLHVLVASHYHPHWRETKYQTSWDDGPILADDNHYNLQDLNDAHQQGQGFVYPQNFAIEYTEAVNDFMTAGGNFIAWIYGHVHNKSFCCITPYPNILCISVSNAGCTTTGINKIERVEDTKTGDDFYILGIDTYTKQLKLIKIGTNYDRIMRHTDTLCFDYGKHTLLYSN